MFGTYAKFFDVIKQTQGTIENPFLIQQSLVTSSVPSATLAGFLTGGCLSPLCSPLEALKCRAQVLGAAENRVFNVKALYSGWSATILRCSFGNAAFFGSYTFTQDLLGIPAWLGGGVAGLCFWLFAMPFDVVKSRMQVNIQAKTSVYSEFSAIFARKYPLRELYAGFPITLARSVPMNAAVFVTYEFVMKTLANDFDL